MTFTSTPTDASNSFIVVHFNINHRVIVAVVVIPTYTVFLGADC